MKDENFKLCNFAVKQTVSEKCRIYVNCSRLTLKCCSKTLHITVESGY